MGHGVIWAERLGHLALDTEVFLLEQEVGIRPRTDTVTLRSPVCNEWLANKFAAHLLDDPGAAVYLDLHPGMDPAGLIETSLPMLHVGFSLDEQAAGRTLLAELGVEGSHVAVHARDAAYLADAIPGGYNGAGWQYHDYRDADIDTYLHAMHTIAGQGHAAVRVGATAAKPLGHTTNHIIDYPYSGLRSDFADCYLVASCRWMLAANSGPCSLAALFRKPIAFANVAPLLTVAGPLFPMGRLFIPKLYRDLGDGHLLSIREIVARGGHNLWWTDSFRQAGIELVDNTPDEIAALAVEMDARLNGTWTEPDDDIWQTLFWEKTGMARPPRLRIGHDFIHRHVIDLFA